MDPSSPSFVLKALSCFEVWQRHCLCLFFSPSPMANAQISMSGPRISAATVVLPCYLQNLQPRKTFKYVNGTSKQSPKMGRVCFPHCTDKEIVFYPK